MPTHRRKRRLTDAYAFPGFRPLATVQGIFGDPKARVVTLRRRSKKRAAALAARLASSESRAAGFPGRQPVLQQAVRHLRRPALPQCRYQGGGQGAASRLACGQGAREAVHAGAARTRGDAGTAHPRHRRSVDSQGTRLSHRSERPGAPAADLVWRQGSQGSEHGRVLRLAGADQGEAAA